MGTVENIDKNHILIGLGAIGGKILREIKKRMFEEFPTAEERGKLPVSLLYIDSTDEMMPKDGRPRPDFRVMGQDASFTNNEFLNINNVDIGYILDNIDSYPYLKGIVENTDAFKSALGSQGSVTGPTRRECRLLFAANAMRYVSSLKDAYKRAEAISGHSYTIIHIFAGLYEATGSGSIVDAIVQAAKLFPNARIYVYAMLPGQESDVSGMPQICDYQDVYAALNELNALQCGRWEPQDVTGFGEIKLYNELKCGVADSITLFNNVNENNTVVESLKELPKIVSDFVFACFFLLPEHDYLSRELLRAFNFESLNDFALEYDETADIGPDGRYPVVRTKKINSLGIKRIIYPETRILKHITYDIALRVLHQFMYNNWREDLGYIAEERAKNYHDHYLSKENQKAWMLDQDHLTLEQKTLESDPDYPGFNDYWRDISSRIVGMAKKSDRPLNELTDILADFYTTHFREYGVESYYMEKERAIPEIAKEVRCKIEHGLFKKWKQGDISFVELQRASSLVGEHLTEMRQELIAAIQEEEEKIKALDKSVLQKVEEWERLSFFKRFLGLGKRIYAEYRELLTDYYTSKTRLVALEFAKKLAAKVSVEIGKLDTDISAFGQKISDAIVETEKLVAAQRKVNKGLEDMRGAIIEVSDEEAVEEFENDLRMDKFGMPYIARELRETILNQGEFVNFGILANLISIDDIKDTFDVKLAEIVRIKHLEKAFDEEKDLGLNILTKLQQQLTSNDDIKAFADQIVRESGVFLKLNTDQIQLHLRNNEGYLSPSNPGSINRKSILISIPRTDENISLKNFVDKLEDALYDSFKSSTLRTSIIINRNSPRKDELSIVTVNYCYPIRAIEGVETYRQYYDNYLNSGDPITRAGKTFLIHSEGDGKQFPSLMPQLDLT